MFILLFGLCLYFRGAKLFDDGYSWLYFRCFMEIVSKLHICENILFIFYLYLFFHFYHESFMTNISSWIQITLCIIVFSQFLKAQKIK